jgi:hypothetical protein
MAAEFRTQHACWSKPRYSRAQEEVCPAVGAGLLHQVVLSPQFRAGAGGEGEAEGLAAAVETAGAKAALHSRGEAELMHQARIHCKSVLQSVNTKNKQNMQSTPATAGRTWLVTFETVSPYRQDGSLHYTNDAVRIVPPSPPYRGRDRWYVLTLTHNMVVMNQHYSFI